MLLHSSISFVKIIKIFYKVALYIFCSFAMPVLRHFWENNIGGLHANNQPLANLK